MITTLLTTLIATAPAVADDDIPAMRETDVVVDASWEIGGRRDPDLDGLESFGQAALAANAVLVRDHLAYGVRAQLGAGGTLSELGPNVALGPTLGYRGDGTWRPALELGVLAGAENLTPCSLGCGGTEFGWRPLAYVHAFGGVERVQDSWLLRIGPSAQVTNRGAWAVGLTVGVGPRLGVVGPGGS